VVSLSINYRYGVRLTDYQNGFRTIRTEVGRTIGLTSDITTIEQEMAMKCLKNGYRVIELPSHEYRRKGGVSKINVLRVGHCYVVNLIRGLIGRRKRSDFTPAPVNSASSSKDDSIHREAPSYGAAADGNRAGGDSAVEVSTTAAEPDRLRPVTQ
jgi:hypothetical protein